MLENISGKDKAFRVIAFIVLIIGIFCLYVHVHTVFCVWDYILVVAVTAGFVGAFFQEE